MGEYMHRHIRTLLALIMTIGLVLGPVASTRPAGATTTVITLTIGNPNITVNGTPKPIDASGTTPVIVGGRTLLPIRAIAEALGGTIGWNATTRTVTISVDVNTLELVIGNRMATVNGAKVAIDAANATIVPVIVGGRTMLPVRFVGEQLGGVVEWNQATRTATLTFMTGIELTAPRLLEPTDTALFTSATVTFRWTPVTYATSYTLVITSGSAQIFRGVSTTTSFSPSGAVLAAGTYSWAVSAAAGSTTGPMSLTSRFTVKLPMSPADIVKVATPSVVEIAVQYADGGTGVAGAFLVDPSGIVVTTYEVIKGAVAGSLFLADGTELTSLRVLGYSPTLDAAILKVPTAKPLPALALIPASEAQVNQDAIMVSPIFAGIPQITVAGVVNTLTQTGFTVRGAAENAVPGSPVLDQFGDVIGMVTTSIRPATGAFPAVSAAAIRTVTRTGDWTLREVTDREGTGLQSLAAPDLGEPVGEAAVATLTPHFRWNTVAGATRYQFWVGEGRNATGDGIVSIVVDYTDPEILPGTLKPGTTYTWAVRAGNEQGWGPWSPDRMFTTSSAIVQPPAPIILEPLNEAVLKAASPVLFWTSVAGADQYYVWVGVSDQEPAVYEVSTTDTSVSIPPGTLKADTSYLWTVRVENSSGVSSLWANPHPSITHSLPIGVGVPSLLAPPPAAVLSTLNPTFSWQDVPGATRYDLYLWTKAGTTNTKAYELSLTGTTWTVPVGTLTAGQSYWWGVIAGNADAWSKTGETWNWSISRTFTITADAVATIVAPIPLEPANGASLGAAAATLRWSTVTAASWYRIWVGKGTSSSAATPVYWKDINNPGAGPVQQLVLPGGTLERGATYWWRVIAGTGTDTATSEFVSFSVAP
jgi:hypothetical protein